MATVTPGPVTPVGGGYATTPSYSGTFIPTLWSSQLAKKFYVATVFSEIANTDWAGELKNMGDKVVINRPPTLTVNKYVIGQGLVYEVPVPSTLELTIDQGLYFAFQVNDVIEYQAKPNLMDMFSNDAGMQMKVRIDSTALFNLSLNPAYGTPAPGNSGANSGVNSGAYGLGTNVAPIALTGANVLQVITALSGVLDEQNVPEDNRWLLLDSYTRSLLMQSNLAQAQFMGDDKSMLRNGRIGMIDRFTVYVTNNLPRGAANGPMKSGDGTEQIGATHTVARRLIIAGHKSAWTFASQITKTEQVRNPYDFGDYIRSLNIFGFKATKPEAFAIAYVTN
jgi:hypothetical protein